MGQFAAYITKTAFVYNKGGFLVSVRDIAALPLKSLYFPGEMPACAVKNLEK